MSLVSIAGGATGTGTFTVLAPSTNTNRTLTLPDSAGTMATAESTLAQFNVSGSAPVFACRAFVNFKGTGTVTIRGSGNVSSVTDNGTGDFTVNFATAMPDVNYAASGLAEGGSSGDAALTIEKSSQVQTTGAMRVFVKQGSTVVDRDYNFLSFFR